MLLDKGTLLVAPAVPGCTDPALGNVPAPQPPAGFPASHRAIALHNTLADVLFGAVIIGTDIEGLETVVSEPLVVGRAPCRSAGWHAEASWANMIALQDRSRDHL